MAKIAKLSLDISLDISLVCGIFFVIQEWKYQNVDLIAYRFDGEFSNRILSSSGKW